MNIKSAAILVGVLAAAFASSAPASAQRRTGSTYFGVNYQGMSFNGVASATNLPTLASSGAGIHVGRRYGWLAAELGLSKVDGSKNVSGTAPYRTNVTLSTVSLDVLGFVPASGPLSIFGTVGAGYASGRTASNNPATLASFNISKNAIAYRIGGGAQWKPVEAFSVDLTARYQGDNIAQIKGGIAYSLGMNFYF